MVNNQDESKSYIQKARKLQREGQFDEAIKVYRKAIDVNPDFSWYYHNLGEALTAVGDWEEAIQYYHKSVETNPSSSWFNYKFSSHLSKPSRENGNWIITLDKHERKVYSQSGEDGVIERIFDKIGVMNKTIVEFGEARGEKNSNSTHLRLNHGWTTILFDRNPTSDLVRAATITAENINSLFEKSGVPRYFDILSIDIDGNDYWVWKAIDDTRFKPRVVIIEFNCNFPIYQSKTIEYNPDHEYDRTKYYGASLAALYKLGKSKGYSLVYHTGPLNAFFVLKELLPVESQDLDIEEVFHTPDVESFGKKWGFGKPTWFDAPTPENDPKNRRWIEI